MRKPASSDLFVRIGAGDAAAQDEVLAGLQLSYAGLIYAVLEAIRAHEMTEHNRFLILAIEDRPFYVQCMFYDEDQWLHCEAASGAYDNWSPTKELTAALASLGYDVTKPDENYSVERLIADEDSLMDIASLLVETLYRAYGLGLDMRLIYEAPFVPGRDLEALIHSVFAPLIR
ncbi:hypothetical protein GCM10011611_12170 [Aliidongia dinghuensis]|uniref:TY-Chap N-terminal domain-containing protein n=1 Tax=Aliidongia dinghuensis TaxID=1867774 RepID=A0A8J3E265_9PROT|nr:hypothetical protein [Aliidongia dinghuensis]GGF08316.1 hypothetical protein GCM10011611_12170 [Aliidongia dinghuensis]